MEEIAFPLRMPAEWEQHAATWIAWPHRRSDWPGKFASIRWVYGEIVRILSRYEPVHILVNDETAAVAQHVLRCGGVSGSSVSLVSIPTDRSWVRDSGPTFVEDADGHQLMLDWRFNAWAKYDDWQADNAIPGRLADRAGMRRVEPIWNGSRVVLEGGAIEVNGTGLMLTTEECLLSDIQARNPTFDRSDYEQVFRQYLGVERVIWLGQGIVGDDTHGHVDDLGRFVNPTTVVLTDEENPSDENAGPLRENRDRLRGESGLEVVSLPMPAPIVFRKQRLPASYANFYIANGCVLVPTFNDPADRVALGLLAELFPDRDVIGIHSVDLVWGLGTLHCLTQQQPTGREG